MVKQKVNLLITTVAVAMLAFALASCAPITENTGGDFSGSNSASVTITLPKLGGSSSIRALSEEQVSRLQSETVKFRITFKNNGMTTMRETTGGAVTAVFEIGSEVKITVECLNAKEQVIVRSVEKTITMKSGVNSVSFKLSEDGEEIIPENGDDGEDGDDDPDDPVTEKFSVTYELDGGDWSPDSEQPQTTEYTEGDTVTVTANVPTKPSFTFIGWKASVSSLTPSGGGDTFAASSTFTMPSAAVTFTAQWTNKPVHDVTYDLGFVPDGGSQTSTVQVAEDASVSLAAPSAERLGYTFNQWLYNGAAAPSDLKMSTNDITLIAEWSAKLYTIAVDKNGASGALANPFANNTYSIDGSNGDAAISINDKPSNGDEVFSGKVFDGWAYTSGGQKIVATTSSLDISAVINESDVQISSSNVITLYAVWKDGGATATVGSTTTTYETFTEAWEAAIPPDGTPSGTVTITLLKNCTATESLLVASGTVTLDVGTFTLTLGSNEINLQGGSANTLGTLNLMGSGGTITGSGSFVVLVDGYGGNLTLSDGVTITSTGASTKGISSNDGGKFDMTGGTITGNKGGGVDISVTFNMSGGTISGNGTASSYFGGVNVSGGTFTMSGGTISGNNAANFGTGSGGGGVNVEGTGTTFIMSGAAEVTPSSSTNNNIALEGGCVITVNAALSKNSVGQIALYDYTGTPTVLDGTAVAANYSKFTLADAGYEIKSDGTVARLPQVGDIIMNDGTFKSATDTITAAAAIAVVYKVDNITRAMYAVGKNLVASGINWAISSAKGYQKIIPLLQTTYTDGRTGLERLSNAVDDAGDANLATNYPAWDYACNYGKNTATNAGIPTEMQSGWYFLTIAELRAIYNAKDIIDASLNKIGGNTFGTGIYWSSTQSDVTDTAATPLNFDNSQSLTFTKDMASGVCAVRQFTY